MEEMGWDVAIRRAMEGLSIVAVHLPAEAVKPAATDSGCLAASGTVRFHHSDRTPQTFPP